MCVIIAKNKGSKYPTLNDVFNCCQRNPDGFAMAWNEKGELKTYRTMSREHFLKHYVAVVRRCSEEDTAMVLHARIATHGSKKLSNCHCWKGCGFAFAHNGVLSNIGSRGDLTDSETFFRDIFEPVYMSGGMEAAERVIRGVIGSSKFALIDGAGTLRLFGMYQKHDGNWYSNESFRGIWEKSIYGNSLKGRMI